MLHMLSRTYLSPKFLEDAVERTNYNELCNLSNSLASNSSKHSFIVWASLLKGPSCITYKKCKQNCERLSFMPIKVAKEATRWFMILLTTSSKPNVVSSRLILCQFYNF